MIPGPDQLALKQELRSMNYQEQHEAVQATLLQTIAAVGAHMQGSNAQLLVLVVLLNRTDDSNQGVRAVASDSLQSQTPPLHPGCLCYPTQVPSHSISLSRYPADVC